MTPKRESSAAHRGQHRDLVAVAQHGRVAVGRFVAVYPHARGVEHTRELRAVAILRGREQFVQCRDVVLVTRAPGRVARLREQSEPNAQRRSSSMGRERWTFVRAAGNASSRAGSIGSPVSSSTP